MKEKEKPFGHEIAVEGEERETVGQEVSLGSAQPTASLRELEKDSAAVQSAASSTTSKVSSTLQHYWNLSSIQLENRLVSANDLILNLKSDLDTFNQSLSSADSAAPLLLSNDLENDTPTTAIALIKNSGVYPDNVSYALKRLVRGLSSSRDGARLGFATALKELLAFLIPTLPVSLFLRHLHETSENNGKKSGQEEREFYFARVFGYYALCLSGILSATHSSTAASKNDFDLMIDNLSSFIQAKDYLAVISTFCALQILEAVVGRDDAEKDDICQSIITKWLAKGLSTPEHVWFALDARALYPATSSGFWNALLGAEWKKSSIMYPKNKAKLLDLLKSASFFHSTFGEDTASFPISKKKKNSVVAAAAAGKKESAAHATTTLHPVFTSLVQAISSPSTTTSHLTISELWTLLEPFFFSTHSHDRKSMGFLFFTQLLLPLALSPSQKEEKSGDDDQVNGQDVQLSLLFTPLFMRCLINSLSNQGTRLFTQASHTISLLLQHAEKSPSLALPLLFQLVGENGHFKFDQLTKTRTVETLSSLLGASDVVHYLESLTGTVFCKPSEGGADQIAMQLWVLDQIYLILKTHKIVKLESVLFTSLAFLVEVGFGGGIKNLVVDPSVSKVAREKLCTVLQHLCNLVVVRVDRDGSHEEEGKEEVKEKSAKAGCTFSGQTWTNYLHALLLSTPASAQTGADIPALLASQKFVESVRGVKESSGLEAAELACFERMFETLGIVFYCNVDQEAVAQEEEDAASTSLDTLRELDECFRKLSADKPAPTPLPSKEKKRKLGEEEVEDGPEKEPLPVEVLVDVLISFLAKPSAVLRALAVDVFKVFGKKAATSAVLDLFIEVLGVDGGVQGAQELFEEQAGNSVTEEEDTVMANADSASSDEDEEEEDDEETENELPADEELRAKIQAALEMDVEQDLEELGDDEMEAFDSKLAEIFSQRKSIKNVKKESKETVLHFKLRVLDLFDLFLKINSASPLFVAAIEPVLDLLHSTSSSSDSLLLHNKLASIVKSRIVNNKETLVLVRPEEKTACLKVVEMILNTCRKSNDANGTLGGICLSLVRSLVHPSNNNEAAAAQQPPKKKKKEKSKQAGSSAPVIHTIQQQIADLFAGAFSHWMTTKNSKIKPSLFTDFSNRYPKIALTLLPAMLSATNPSLEPKSFQVVKTFEMAAHLVKNVPKTAQEKDLDVKQVCKLYGQTLEKVLQKAGDAGDKGPHGMPKDRIKTLLKAFGMVARKANLVMPAHEKWVDGGFVETLQSVADHERFKCAAVTSLVKQTLLLLSRDSKK